VSALSILAGTLIARSQLVNPLQQILTTADAITRGHFESRLTIKKDNEIGLLARAINTMLDSLHERISFEHLITAISSDFIYFDVSNLDDMIIESLGMIGEFSGFDRCFFMYQSDAEKEPEWFFWCRDNCDQFSKVMKQLFTGDSWVHDELEQKKPVIIASVNSLPDDAGMVRGALVDSGVNSLFCVPVEYSDALTGICGGDMLRKDGEKQPDSRLLNMAGEIFVYALERRKTKRALISSESRYRELADSLPLSVVEIDIEGSVSFMNKYSLTMFGINEVDIERGFNLVSFFAEESEALAEQNMKRVLSGETVNMVECTAQKSDGTTFPVLVSGKPVIKDNTVTGIRSVIIDISDRKRIEEEFLKIEKLESVGLLSAGIAHDFNNILSSIIGNISIARYMVKTGNRDSRVSFSQILDDAEKACYRASMLTQQLLTFSKGGAPVKKAGILSTIVEETATFCLRGSTIDLKVDIMGDIKSAMYDEGQISQVINNLTLNAKQVMPNGGSVYIKIENIDTLPAHVPLPHGDYIKIMIQDNGPGIKSGDMEKIFDPYFTTRQSGSGLGLTSAFSIIKQHKGYIDLESAEGVGTTFTIYLPSCGQSGCAIEESTSSSELSGSGTVLVMDDEDDILTTITMMLKHLGYSTVTAEKGETALELYSNELDAGRRFSCVILDLTVPGGMGGVETISRLYEMDPDVTAIVSSGYSNDMVMSEYEKYHFKDVITKPYTITELGKVLRKVVGNG
jgi:PAS domain S-box-containing protein